VFDLPLHQATAAIPGQNEQAQDRVTMNASHTLHAPNAHAFQQQLQDVCGLIQRQPHLVQRTLVIFGEGFPALIAAVTLKAVAMLPKPFAGDPAGVARHFEP
jgi:hypothetical protein